jgi:hypothetical protein
MKLKRCSQQLCRHFCLAKEMRNRQHQLLSIEYHCPKCKTVLREIYTETRLTLPDPDFNAPGWKIITDRHGKTQALLRAEVDVEILPKEKRTTAKN